MDTGAEWMEYQTWIRIKKDLLWRGFFSNVLLIFYNPKNCVSNQWFFSGYIEAQIKMHLKFIENTFNAILLLLFQDFLNSFTASSLNKDLEHRHNAISFSQSKLRLLPEKKYICKDSFSFHWQFACDTAKQYGCDYHFNVLCSW